MQTGNSDKKLCGRWGGRESKVRGFLRVCLSLLKQKRGQLLPVRDDAAVPLICGIQHFYSMSSKWPVSITLRFYNAKWMLPDV